MIILVLVSQLYVCSFSPTLSLSCDRDPGVFFCLSAVRFATARYYGRRARRRLVRRWSGASPCIATLKSTCRTSDAYGSPSTVGGCYDPGHHCERGSHEGRSSSWCWSAEPTEHKPLQSRPKSQRGAGADAAVSSVAAHGVHHDLLTLRMRERDPQPPNP